jgi:hypothetical protein
MTSTSGGSKFVSRLGLHKMSGNSRASQGWLKYQANPHVGEGGSSCPSSLGSLRQTWHCGTPEFVLARQFPQHILKHAPHPLVLEVEQLHPHLQLHVTPRGLPLLPECAPRSSFQLAAGSRNTGAAANFATRSLAFGVCTTTFDEYFPAKYVARIWQSPMERFCPKRLI